MQIKKWLITLLAIPMCMCVCFTGCGEEPVKREHNFQYFTFYHIDGFKSRPSYIDEVCGKDLVNLVIVGSNGEYAERMQKVKDYGCKAMSTLGGAGIFTGGRTTVYNSATLVSDWQTRLTNTINNVNSFIEDGTLISFYFDEPAWNGIKEEDFRTVTKWLRETYPTVRILACLTVYDIGAKTDNRWPKMNSSYIEYLTDVTYDSYETWSTTKRQGYLQKLKDLANRDQGIWGCAKGMSNSPQLAKEKQDLFNNIEGFYNEGINEPRYEGILSFSYLDGDEGDWGYGLQTMFDDDEENDYFVAGLEQKYKEIFRKIVNKG